jgi:hypothetical protein
LGWVEDVKMTERKLQMATAVAELREDAVSKQNLTALADQAFKGISERCEWGLNLVRFSAIDVNAPSSLGMTPLFAACYALWEPGARALLDMGANPSCGLNGGNAATAAFIAAVDRHERFTLQTTDDRCVDVLHTLYSRGIRLAYVRRAEADVALQRLCAAAARRGHLVLAEALIGVVRM